MAEKGIGLREELNKLDRANGGGGISKFICGVVTRSTRKWELGLPRRIFCTPSCDVTIPNAAIFICGSVGLSTPTPVESG